MERALAPSGLDKACRSFSPQLERSCLILFRADRAAVWRGIPEVHGGFRKGEVAGTT